MPKEIIIEILRRQGRAPRKKTLALPSRRKEVMGRRRTGGIRFWDMGYVLNGENYETLPFLDPNRDSPIPHQDEIIGSGEVNLALDEDPFPYDTSLDEFYGQINDEIFTRPIAEWQEHFYQIDNSYRANVAPVVGYRGTAYNFNTSNAWNGERLLPNGVQSNTNFAVHIDPQLFTPFTINAAGGSTFRGTKITTEFDYAAAATAFTPSRSMDVFLVPNLLLEKFDATHTRQTPGFLDFKFDFLNWLHTIYPREVLHEASHDLYGRYLTSFSWQLGGTLADYEDVYAVTEHWKANRGERALRGQVQVFLPDDFTDIDPTEYAPASAFPAPPPEPTDPDLAQYMIAILEPKNPASHFSGGWPIDGALLAVIKKGGTYYYVWSD